MKRLLSEIENEIFETACTGGCVIDLIEQKSEYYKNPKSIPQIEDEIKIIQSSIKETEKSLLTCNSQQAMLERFFLKKYKRKEGYWKWRLRIEQSKLSNA